MLPAIVPNVAEPGVQAPLGALKVTLFHTFEQSASNVNDISRGSEKLRFTAASMFCEPGLFRFKARVRGVLPIRYCAVDTVLTLVGDLKAFTSKYGSAGQLPPICGIPMLQAVVPLELVP